MKRFVILTALLLIPVMVLPAYAKDKKPMMSDNFQAGLDIGAYFFSAIPYSSAEFTSEGTTEKASIAGAGGFGMPLIGAHFNLMAAKSYIIHFDLAYGYQTGTAKFNFENKDLDSKQFNFSMQTIRASVGVGQAIIQTAIVKPYWMLGLTAGEMILDGERGHNGTHDNASGIGIGPWAALGLDAKIVHTKGVTFFAGGQFRLDVMYTAVPLTRTNPDTTITMAYVPVSLILTGGVQF